MAVPETAVKEGEAGDHCAKLTVAIIVLITVRFLSFL